MRAAILSCLLASCASTGDIRAVYDTLDRLEAKLDGETREAVEEAKNEVAQVAAQADERNSFWERLFGMDGTVAAIITVAGMAGLHVYRNRTRRTALMGKATP